MTASPISRGHSAQKPVIRVVVVEDSQVQQAHLVRSLEADGDIEVVGRATTTTDAIARVAALRPDVVTLDLQLADGDGRCVIEQIMAHTPTPILVLSAIVEGRQSGVAVEALASGALEALPKPARWAAGDEVELRRSVRRLNKVLVIRHMRGHVKSDRPPGMHSGGAKSPVVALASSAGGPAALSKVLSGLAGLAAPVLVVQHLHPDFIDGLASWMARVSALPVEVAEHGRHARPGHVYIAPGHFHLRLDPGNCLLLDPAPVTTHRPSANELFRSVAERAGAAGVGVVMTGMGDDGALGLLELRRQGGQTFGQDEASCAVFGMPQAAQRLGAVMDMLPIGELAAAVVRTVRAMRP